MEKHLPVAVGTNEDLKDEVGNNNIPDDFAFSILSKLPIKSLKRFGCVRKSWSLLFENPYFMNMLRNHFLYINNRRCSDYGGDTFLFLYEPVRHDYYRPSLYLLSNDKFENRIKLDLPPPFHDADECEIYILGSVSVNGIFCLGKYTRRGIVNALWNPATPEVMVIPPSPDESVPTYRYPKVRFHGFGYDNVKDDYKLIRYILFHHVTDEDEDENEPLGDRSYDPFLEIYSLRSNSWRILDVNVPDCHYEDNDGVYMDGVCHWWGNTDFCNDEGYLVSFDLRNEVFFTTPTLFDMELSRDPISIELPQAIERRLVVLNESIALISNRFKATTFHISILVEVGVKESWIKLFIVGPIPSIGWPIAVGKKGHICFGQTNDELVWIDLSTQIIDEIGVKNRRLSFYHMGIYKESLLRIGGINN